jgi:hypothetical protein
LATINVVIQWDIQITNYTSSLLFPRLVCSLKFAIPIISNIPRPTAFSVLTLRLTILLVRKRWCRIFDHRKIYQFFLFMCQMHWLSCFGLLFFSWLLFRFGSRANWRVYHIPCVFLNTCCEFSSIEILFCRGWLIHRCFIFLFDESMHSKIDQKLYNWIFCYF